MLSADTLRDHLAAAFSCSEPEIDVGCTPSASDADPCGPCAAVDSSEVGTAPPYFVPNALASRWSAAHNTEPGALQGAVPCSTRVASY